MLEKLGLDAEAGAVDKEMLKDPQSRPGDIALRLGWEGARVRSALDELARLALLRPSWQEPGVLKPVDPEESRMGALVLRGRGVVSALCELFERVRQSSLPVTSEPEAPLGREKPALSPAPAPGRRRSAGVGNAGVGNAGVGNAGVGNAGVGNAGVARLGSRPPHPVLGGYGRPPPRPGVWPAAPPELNCGSLSRTHPD